jgi:hypothetical protein
MRSRSSHGVLDDPGVLRRQGTAEHGLDKSAHVETELCGWPGPARDNVSGDTRMDNMRGCRGLVDREIGSHCGVSG